MLKNYIPIEQKVEIKFEILQAPSNCEITMAFRGEPLSGQLKFSYGLLTRTISYSDKFSNY